MVAADNIKEVTAVADTHDADVILYNGPIDYKGFYRILAICGKKKRPNVVLMLTTYGGDANAAFRIARQLKNTYQKVVVFVTSRCKSAGTLVVLGADEVVMSDAAELGPLDIQLRKRDELLEYGSGLDMTQAMQFLGQSAMSDLKTYIIEMCVHGEMSTKFAAQIATKLVSGLYHRVYAQIDPIRLSEAFRAMMIAQHYGLRLQANVQEGGLVQLLTGYPSHSFVIDRKEAEDIFNVVRAPTKIEQELDRLLHGLTFEPHVEDATVLLASHPEQEEQGHDEEDNVQPGDPAAAASPASPPTGDGGVGADTHRKAGGDPQPAVPSAVVVSPIAKASPAAGGSA